MQRSYLAFFYSHPLATSGSESNSASTSLPGTSARALFLRFSGDGRLHVAPDARGRAGALPPRAAGRAVAVRAHRGRAGGCYTAMHHTTTT